MATITYNPEESQEGELNAEEKSSLALGEQIAEQENQLLAGKFKDAQELEKAYVELQSKLGKREETPEPEEQVEEQSEPKVDLLERLWEESGGEFTQETLDELKGKSSEEVAQMYLNYRKDNQQPDKPTFTEDDAQALRDRVGGTEKYNEMLQWAAKNMDEKEADMYDQVMAQGDPASMFFAVEALKARYTDNVGQDGQLLTGRTSPTRKDVFRSQAEVVRAMSDPRYEKDPAYRQDIFDKLEVSDLNWTG